MEKNTNKGNVIHVSHIPVHVDDIDMSNDMKMKVLTETSHKHDKSMIVNSPKLMENDMNEILFSKQWTEFAEVVSIVGLRYAVIPSASFARKLFWSVLVLFGTGFMLYQVSDRISYYLSWPTTVNLQVKYNSTLRFPTVTICNENKMTRAATDRLGMTSVIQSMFAPFPNVVFNPNYNIYENAHLKANWNDMYEAFAQSRQEAVFNCIYEMNYCNLSEAFEITPTNMGFCFSFNPKSINYVTSNPGATYGLNLMLYVNQSDYMVTNSPSAGFRVLLHEPNESPLMKQWGFKVSPGYDTMVSVSLTNITQLPAPYGDCSDNETYTYNDCMAICQADYVIEQCGCRQPEMPGTVDVCNPYLVDTCVNNATDVFDVNIASSCNCPRQCHQRSYQYTISQSEFSEYFVDFITEYTFNNKFPTTFFRENFLVLEIFYSELTYEDIQTLTSYDLLSLLCDIGGALGLILGSTVLTFFEIVDFFLGIIWEFIIYKTTKKADKKMQIKY